MHTFARWTGMAVALAILASGCHGGGDDSPTARDKAARVTRGPSH